MLKLFIKMELIESCNTQLEVFSPHIADLLIQCCVQIEALSKELYYDLGGVKPRGDNTIFFDEDSSGIVIYRSRSFHESVGTLQFDSFCVAKRVKL